MYVQVTGERDNLSVIVMGEPLAGQPSGPYKLPGRLVKALKPQDLPMEVCFTLDGSLSSGYGFYPEDRVVFQRGHKEQSLWIRVTSTYVQSEWDGFFPLEATLQARKQALEEQSGFVQIGYEAGEQISVIHYEFEWERTEPTDLESALEAICDTVCDIEARGNANLWPRKGPSFG
ncbi:hypothetical protein [Brevibacillus centrosporus]|uniref:hypothetical protein n=1 Tax=Brevibacillus centrosporus TaxID=54910 RepID=UPI0037F56C4F